MPNPPDIRRPLVVVIEDDDAVLNSLRFGLEVEGFAVLSFRSAEEVLGTPIPGQCCLLVDYRLPAMNGLTLLTCLRQPGTERPAVLMTSNPSMRLRREAADLGIELVEKPLLGQALMEVIRRLTSEWADSQ